MTQQPYRPGRHPSGLAYQPATGPPGGPAPARPPSGLFPAGRSRPSYREPHPVRTPGVLAGLGVGALWMLLFGLIASTLAGYGWWTILAGAVAWLAALLLGRVGDRGVATGVAISAAVGWSIATVIIAERWFSQLDWPLW